MIPAGCDARPGRRFLRFGILALTLLLTVATAADARRGRDKAKEPEPAEKPAGPPTVAEKTEGLELREGFVDFYLDADGGRLWLVIPPPVGDQQVALEFLYLEGLTSGLGSNPVGLDRGQVGESQLLRFRRIGHKVLLEAPNLRYRALDAPAEEQQAARESFASSILWAQEVAALDPDGRSLIDFTSFLIRDAHDIVPKLREAQQGSYSLDTGRSLLDPANCLAFPDNIELEALLTYSAGSDPGEEVQATAADPSAITLIQHHSLVRLPDDGYQTRQFDPRVGVYPLAVRDYAAPLGGTDTHRWLQRHRLEKTDPSAERSTAVEPLVYYVDSGVPEPVRSALLDGARWWQEAFERAGFIDGYRVELLPEDVHPLDARYNVIQWVHRATRGWSYGSVLTDPRTGEVIKGHVNLGSLRVRQDILLFEGLLGTAKTGSGAPDDPVQLALARIRQLSAHEVGHTLGITHNFAASTYGDRESVMDYPAPLITFDDDGELDVSQAYGVGVGEWDVQAVQYAYGQPSEGQSEEAMLAGIVQRGLDEGLLFLSDSDARPPGASDPRANLWDNGSDPVAAFELALAVRRHGLDRFGPDRLTAGRPVAELEEVLAPLYFHHRYQLDAVVKVLGGLEYDYALVGDGQAPSRIVDGERQLAALEAVLRLLEPAELDLRDEVLALLVPRPFGYEPNREMFASATAPAFDPLGAAHTAADQAIQGLLQPERLLRVMDFHRRDPSMPSVAAVLETVIARTWGPADESPRHAAIRAVVRQAVADRLVQLAHHALYPLLRGAAEAALEDQLLPRARAADDSHSRAVVRDVVRFLERTDDEQRFFVPAAEPPPGSPIGSATSGGFGWHGFGEGCSHEH